MTRHSHAHAIALDRADTETLTPFVRAYLHEDHVVEYGNPINAAKAFAADASADERARVAAALDRLADAATGRSVVALRRFITHELHGAWRPALPVEIRALATTIRRGLPSL
jgi:hypothetical protein